MPITIERDGVPQRGPQRQLREPQRQLREPHKQLGGSQRQLGGPPSQLGGGDEEKERKKDRKLSVSPYIVIP